MTPQSTIATLDTASAGSAPAALEGACWQHASIALLSVRITQGFVYWGGGSRRFIYDPTKLDPDAHTWMAEKFQSAMPGALLGTDQLIAYLLQNFWLLYPAIILFSAAELIAGLALVAGLLTRLAALATIGFSIVLQLMFGWQGGTCLDEWTMAACNLAMGATLFLGGSGVYSIDNALLRRAPDLASRIWFRWAAGSLPLPLAVPAYRRLGLGVLAPVLAFNVGTYSYFRGAVVTPYHAGPVSPTTHHFSLSDGRLLRDGAVRFDIYLDGGTSAVPAHIVKAELLGADGWPVETWNSPALSRLPAQAIDNEFDYNKFTVGPYGIVARMGARATITLPPAPGSAGGVAKGASLTLTDIDDHRFGVKLGE